MDVEEDPEQLMEMPRAHQLFTNCIIRIDRGNFLNLRNYKIRISFAYRLVIYAMIDMVEEGLNPYKKSVKEYAEAHYEEYVRRVVYRARHDQRYENFDVLEEKLLGLKGRLVSHEFDTVYLRLEHLVIKVNRKTSSSGFLVANLSFTKFGQEIKKLIEKGYVF